MRNKTRQGKASAAATLTMRKALAKNIEFVITRLQAAITDYNRDEVEVLVATLHEKSAKLQ